MHLGFVSTISNPSVLANITQVSSASYTIPSSVYFLLCIAGSSSMTLPDAITNTGKIFSVKNTNGSTVTIVPVGGQTVDGDSSGVLLQNNDAVTMLSNGSNWILV
jgi:hypothetical protein